MNATRLQREHHKRAAGPSLPGRLPHSLARGRSIARLNRGTRCIPRRGGCRNNAWLNLRLRD
jgi:hypothetical protein